MEQNECGRHEARQIDCTTGLFGYGWRTQLQIRVVVRSGCPGIVVPSAILRQVQRGRFLGTVKAQMQVRAACGHCDDRNGKQHEKSAQKHFGAGHTLAVLPVWVMPLNLRASASVTASTIRGVGAR